MTIKKPSIWNLVGPVIGIVTLGMIFGFYLWLDFKITKKIVTDDGFTNWLILIISLTFSLIMAFVIH